MTPSAAFAAAAGSALDWSWLLRQWWFIVALLAIGLVLREIASQLDGDD
jgi:hypothetical protein